MPVTLSSLLDDVRERIDEITARRWSDVSLITWINEGARDVARRSEVLQDRKDIAALANVQEYTLPTDMIRVHRVEFKPTGSDQIYTLEYKDFNNLDAVWWSSKSVTTGTPALFTMWGFPPSAKLIAYPTPSVSGTFTVYYYRFPTTVASDTDQVELPEGWHDLVVNYCEYLALRKDADPRWREAKQIYEENLGNLFDISRRWSDQAGSIEVNTTMVPGWLVNDSE